MSASSSVQTITGETVSLYYSNSGTRTSDAGQAAGTAVMGQLAYKNILDVDGSKIATFNDTSLSFTGNCFTTEVKYPIDDAETSDFDTWANKLAAVTADLANGEYCVDYRSGTVYGVKATTTSSLTSTTYKINKALTGGTAALPSEVQAEGQAAEDAAATGNPVLTGGRYDTSDRTLDNGDVGAIAIDVAGRQKVVGAAAEDAAVVGNPVLVGGRYDATARTLDDGDVGANALDAAGNVQVVGNVAHDAVDTGNPLKIGGIARSAQQTAVAAADRVQAVFNLFGELVIAGYTWATNSIRTEEIDPLSSHYLNESLVDTTNVSAATHYYPGATGDSMDGYADLSLSGKFIDADGTLTLTLEVMNDEDTSSGDWIQAYFYDDKNDVNVNSLTVTNGTLTFLCSANNCNFRYYRWVVVASGATNTVILKQRKKAL